MGCNEIGTSGTRHLFPEISPRVQTEHSRKVRARAQFASSPHRWDGCTCQSSPTILTRPMSDPDIPTQTDLHESSDLQDLVRPDTGERNPQFAEVPSRPTCGR